MGYKPTRKCLKEDAVPTIFDDRKPVKRRKTSVERHERKQKDELLSELLLSNDDATEMTEIASDDDAVSCKKKGHSSTRAKKKSAKQKCLSKKCKLNINVDEIASSDKGVQVAVYTEDKATFCDIQIDRSMSVCSTCFGRQYPNLIQSDHSYTRTNITSTPDKLRPSENQTISNPNESDRESIANISPVKKIEMDESFKISDVSDESDVKSSNESSDDSLPSSPLSTIEYLPPKALVAEPKFLVFSSCLDVLLGMVRCAVCHSPLVFEELRRHVDGSAFTISCTCLNSHPFSWRSQPFFGKQALGNLLLSAATYVSGNTYSTIAGIANTLNMEIMGKTAFHDIAYKFIVPAIHQLYTAQQSHLLRVTRNRSLTVVGDGRCDSPGFSAKYCTYTFMEGLSSANLDFNVDQVTETGSSARMELEGFKRSHQFLKEGDIEINIICTDGHVQIRKYVKDVIPDASHQFDVWHMANSIRKKLSAAAKKKGADDLKPWVRSIVNHVWYCASECNKDPDLLIEMWKSILCHIRNVHTFLGKKFSKCAHAALQPNEARKKKWLDGKSKSYKALESIVLDSRLLKDLRHINLFCHAGEIEVYHSMMLKYVPKRLGFQYPHMVARTQLAVIDHNLNIRDQRVDRAGNSQYNPVCPKATQRWVARTVYEEKGYEFRHKILETVLNNKYDNKVDITPHQAKAIELPKNIATTPAPSKSDLVEAHCSRFKLN